MKLGQKITIDKKLVRVTRQGDRNIWEERKIKPTEVIVIGKRRLSNGHTEYDDGYYYMASEYFSAYLVVKDMNSKPFYIEKI